MDFFDAVSFTATIKSISEDGPGEFEAILSTPDVDREKESVLAGALTLPPSIPIYVDHDWRAGALPIGKAVPRYENGHIIVKGIYARHDRAQDVRQLVSDGIIDSMSVGFLNGKRSRDQKSGITQVTSGEVFEGSFTGIPVNTGARVLASKAVADVKAGARNASTDQQRLDEIHDLAVATGANCPAMGDGKAVTDAADTDAPSASAAACDTAIDEAVKALAAGDVDTAADLLVAASAAIDDVLDFFGVADPDDTTKSATTKATGEAAAPNGAAADPAADEVEQVKARLRLLAVTV